MSTQHEKNSADDRVAREELLKDLPSAEIVRRLMSMPARQRLEVILGREDAEDIVSGMADQDFFLTVKEVGPEDALPLLALATMDQLNHVFDIEWWRKDTVLPANALEWLHLLLRAGGGRILSWLSQADFELLTLLFKKWIRVVTIPEDVDLLEARDQLPVQTLDDQFFWECRYPQYEDLVRSLLSLIFETHHGFYLELMNHILWLPDAECEESAYRFHRGRLEDRGVPDFYDALTIYSAPRPRDLKRRSSAEGPPFEGDVPSFALAVTREGDLLRRCLEAISDHRLLDTLRFELASLANKVLVADELPPDEPEALRRAADKAAAYVNLGLTERSGGRPALAAALLTEVYLEDFFRLGHEKISKISRRIQTLVRSGWLARWPHSIHCLDPGWLEWVELMLQRTPQVLRGGGNDPRGEREDFFRSTHDLMAAEQRAGVIEVVGLLFDALGLPEIPPRWKLWPEGMVSRMEDVTLGTMIWTAAAQRLVHGEWRVQPLRVSEWESMWGALEPGAMEQAIGDWTLDVLGDREKVALADLYLGPIHREYARQATSGRGRGGTPPDPRLMRFFLFGEE